MHIFVSRTKLKNINDWIGKDVMNVAFLGLGGNMGDRLGNLRKTVKAIESGCGAVMNLSGVYETEAWGSDSKNKYLNQVVEVHTLLNPQELLEKLLSIEEKLGRVRTGEQNSDRTADLDILLFNDLIVNFSHIQIPHPRLHLRKFVLVPLCEIAKDLIHPVLKKSMEEILLHCTDDLEVKKVGLTHKD